MRYLARESAFRAFRTKRNALGSASILGFVLAVAGGAPAAAAQAPDDDQAEAADVLLDEAAETAARPEDTIVVTATRVARSGFEAPTPTIVLGREDFQLSGEADIGSYLHEIPMFTAGNAPVSMGNDASRIGGNFINLRGLGPARTLVLVNGRRHVSTNVSGWVDANAIPTILLDRVEVVTGGASAAWGSDAIVGVVNFILDRNIEGVRAEAQYGISEYGDNAEYKAALAFGTGFDGGRGHFTIGAEISESEGIPDQSDRPWSAQEWHIIANPAFTPTNGEPQNLILPNVHISRASLGGLIVTGPLTGTQFLPGGGTAPFTFGPLRSGPLFMVGGDGVSMGQYTALSVPFDRQSAFAYAEYAFSDQVTLWGEASYARSHSVNDVVMPFDFGTILITTENAFLPDNVRQQLLAAGQTSFRMGRLSTDMGFYTADNTAETKRGAVGLNGALGGGWEWDVHYQYGVTNYDGLLRSRISNRYTMSIDSVIDPATGQPACRVNTDADPANDAPGCVPVNLFGQGAPQQEAIDWFMGWGGLDLKVQQQTAAANLRGEPFSTWAGPVSLAVGAEWRKEEVDGDVDELSLNNRFHIGNQQPIEGQYNVKEVYAETVIPLLRESPIGHAFDLNAALRLTDYSTSGRVNTWKVGATYSITEALRLRGTRSRDIRAPNANELFTTNQLAFSSIRHNGVNITIPVVLGGNPDLLPEIADTLTLGAVYSPPWVPGLRFSVDYFDIDIEGASGILPAQQILDRCNAGNQALCAFVTRDGDGTPTQIRQVQINLNRLNLEGVDFELRYNTPLDRFIGGSAGNVGLHVLVSHIMDRITDDGVTALDRAGDLSPDANGVPKWRWTANAYYQLDPLLFRLQGRYVGSGLYDHTLEPGGVNDNTIPSAFFLDATMQYTWRSSGGLRAELFLGVDNLLDKDPPIAPQNFLTPLATNNAFYDVAGRSYTVGARFRF